MHYFHHDLQRTEVTLSEFTEALEVALRGLGLNVTCDAPKPAERTVDADLRQLAAESGKAFELGFFARLRQEVRTELQKAPQLIRFVGLRGCVKQLVGARRWSSRCRRMEHQILEFLRHCVQAETNSSCSLLVS